MADLKHKSPTGFPRFGDIFDADLNPIFGAETGKRRPVLVVSNNVNNEFSSTVTILPITSKTPQKAYPFEVLAVKGIGGLTENSRIKANQIRTIDKKRLVGYRGLLPDALLDQVETALRVHLNMKVL
jgi:mRNA interferase MazF